MEFGSVISGQVVRVSSLGPEFDHSVRPSVVKIANSIRL